MGGVNGEKLKNPQPAQQPLALNQTPQTPHKKHTPTHTLTKQNTTNITSQHTAKHQTSHIQLTHTKPQRKH
jgi:hypothetical protein